MGISNSNDKIFELYILAIMQYEKRFKDRVDDIDDIYPEGWDGIKDYKAKIEIIADAIKGNSLIVDTPSYLNVLEGVETGWQKI